MPVRTDSKNGISLSTEKPGATSLNWHYDYEKFLGYAREEQQLKLNRIPLGSSAPGARADRRHSYEGCILYTTKAISSLSFVTSF